jgi:ketosteroid isomerase-like protein
MPDANESTVAKGLGEVEAFTRSWLAQWDEYRIVAEEFRAVERDKVLVSVRQVAKGRRSGAQVESPGFSVWTLRDGKVVGLSLHYDRAEALEAAGLQA